MSKTSRAIDVLSAIIFTIFIISIVYAVMNHYIIVNTCGSNYTLVSFNRTVFCFPQLNDTIIVKGEPYDLNSSLYFYKGQYGPLDISFLDNHPLLSIWNSNSSYPSGSYVFLTIPDTFKVHFQYHSSVETELLIMTNTQYVNWVNSGMEKSTGVYQYVGYSPNFWFNDSQGCAGYVAIIKSLNGSGFTIEPNETALYDPTNYPTGICAGSSNVSTQI